MSASEGNNIHLVLYANGQPYEKVKKLTINSVNNFTKRNLIIHDYDLKKIKKLNWFKCIEKLPAIKRPGMRDGYYNAWKAFIVKDVYDQMNESDILYYVDSSKYFINGFTENIDKICDIASKKKQIAGSVGNDIKNKDHKCCDNLKVWNCIIPQNDNRMHLNKMHVLNSWFLFKKCEKNNAFINEWAHFSSNDLVTLHHTGDQSIFNILVNKYNLIVFYHKKIYHNENKNKNLVLNIINNTVDFQKYFIYISAARKPSLL